MASTLLTIFLWLGLGGCIVLAVLDPGGRR